MSCRIGVDVGGTFTDFVMTAPGGAGLHTYKEPSTPDDPSLAVERGIAALLAAHSVAPGAVDTVVHGTTLGLNAILQRKGASTVLVVSRGNRDVLELARCRMPSPYDFSLPRDEPLLPRDRVIAIDARSDSRGVVMARPDATELDRVAGVIEASGAQAAAVTLINAYLDPALEQEVAAGLGERLPGVHVTPSTRVWPDIREYERAMLAVMNAYVHPMLDAYYQRLEERLQNLGLGNADLYITASNGGTLSVASARERPVDTLLSGPASGVVAACRLTTSLGMPSMVSIDMGGTSCDMAVAQGDHPSLTTRAHLGEFPVIAPVVDVSAIGAGGGSIVWVDSQGILKVGPGSAGADPGPVCYRRGGEAPTITDCFLLTGLVSPDAFLGGRMQLDRIAASEALVQLGARLGFNGPEAAIQTADAALRVATAMMSTALYKELAQRGVDPRGLHLVAFGGAGPTQAALLADEARLDGIVVPASPGTFCALGAIQSQVRRDFVRTLRVRLDDEGAAAKALGTALDTMRTEALDWVANEGRQLADPEISRSADMRYAGQAYDLRVDLDDETASDINALAERFHAEHTRLYGFPDRDSDIELMSITLSVTRAMRPIDPPSLAAATDAPTPRAERDVYVGGTTLSATVYDRAALAAGQRIDGPAIFEQIDTTVWLPPGWGAEVQDNAALVLNRRPKRESS